MVGVKFKEGCNEGFGDEAIHRITHIRPIEDNGRNRATFSIAYFGKSTFGTSRAPTSALNSGSF